MSYSNCAKFIVRHKYRVITTLIIILEFSGAVKITPAHDPNDFEIGVNHGLPFLNVFNEDGTVNDNGGEFRVSNNLFLYSV